MNYRIATKKDISIMCQIRKQQLIDEGIDSDPNISIDEEWYRYFEETLSEGSLVEWLLEKDGMVIATAAIVLLNFRLHITI